MKVDLKEFNYWLKWIEDYGLWNFQNNVWRMKMNKEKKLKFSKRWVKKSSLTPKMNSSRIISNHQFLLICKISFDTWNILPNIFLITHPTSLPWYSTSYQKPSFLKINLNSTLISTFIFLWIIHSNSSYHLLLHKTYTSHYTSQYKDRLKLVSLAYE